MFFLHGTRCCSAPSWLNFRIRVSLSSGSRRRVSILHGAAAGYALLYARLLCRVRQRQVDDDGWWDAHVLIPGWIFLLYQCFSLGTGKWWQTFVWIDQKTTFRSYPSHFITNLISSISLIRRKQALLADSEAGWQEEGPVRLDGR